MKNVKRLTVMAMLIALCVLGAMIKIFQTIAFDSFPGFIAAGLLTPYLGGIVGAIGHLISAASIGFPNGLLSHLLIACTMFITMFVYGYLYKKNRRIIAVIVATLLNGPIGLIPFIYISGIGFYVQFVFILTLASFLNILIATIVLPQLKKVYDKLIN